AEAPREPALTVDLDPVFRTHWWHAVATVSRLVGDVELAEDAVQEACAAALAQWPTAGLPANPGAWLVGTARHKALDRIRRESRRHDREAAAVRELGDPGVPSRSEERRVGKEGRAGGGPNAEKSRERGTERV